MTNHRSDSQANPSEPAKVVRLVDVKSARQEASLPDDGIRPTKEGPWDPCRYQEYEISPEFRRKIMTAKPPPVDPKLFVETFPPTTAAELLGQEKPGDLCETVALDPRAFAGHLTASNSPLVEGEAPPAAAEDTVATEPAAVLRVEPEGGKRGGLLQHGGMSQQVVRSRKSARRVMVLILAVALLDLLSGLLSSHLKKADGGSIASTMQAAPKATPVAASALTPLARAEPTLNAANMRIAQTSATPSQVAPAASNQASRATALVAQQPTSPPSATNTQSKQSSSKPRAPRTKTGHTPELFPMEPDD